MYHNFLFLGAVKITPAHDPADHDVGLRHNLPFLNIMTDDGMINDVAGEQFKVNDLLIHGIKVGEFLDFSLGNEAIPCKNSCA